MIVVQLTQSTIPPSISFQPSPRIVVSGDGLSSLSRPETPLCSVVEPSLTALPMEELLPALSLRFREFGLDIGLDFLLVPVADSPAGWREENMPGSAMEWGVVRVSAGDATM